MMRSSVLPAAVLRRGLLSGAAAVSVALVLSACGGSDHSAGSGANHGANPTSAAASANASVNDADVTFAQSMIPHHRQALQMAAMAAGSAGDPEVKALATKVKEAQQPEIDTMNQWLTAWGKPAPDASMDPGMHGSEHESMPGMMSEADMAKLQDATGAAFDKLFLTMMIGHHNGAIEMAEQEVAQGSNPDAKALAEKIISDQQAEIATMQKILDRL